MKGTKFCFNVVSFLLYKRLSIVLIRFPFLRQFLITDLNFKIKNFDFDSCNHIFTPEVKSIMLATNVLKSGKNKKEVKNDLLSMMAPPIIQRCSTLAEDLVPCNSVVY